MTFKYKTVLKTQKSRKRKPKYEDVDITEDINIDDTSEVFLPAQKLSKKQDSFAPKSFQQIYKSVEDKRSFLETSEGTFMKNFLALLRTSLEQLFPDSLLVENSPLDFKKKAVDLVCYGLGSIENSALSQWQLALILVAFKELQLTGTIFFFDPIAISEAEIKYMTFQKITVLEKNEEGRRKIENPTLFYMPHCPLTLYERVIEFNWSLEKLCKISILGNRLANYQENTTDKRMHLKAPYTLQALRLGIDIHIIEEFPECPGAFNDLAFHNFLKWEVLPNVELKAQLIDPELVSMES